jgi:hypothetical protein
MTRLEEKVKRFNPDGNGMAERPGGRWVTYEEHLRVLQHLEDLGPLLGLDEVREKLLGEEAEAAVAKAIAYVAGKPGEPSSHDRMCAAAALGAIAALDTFNPPVEEGECYSCGEPGAGKCPKSKRACGHHCNCSWVHDHCHWCGEEFGEEKPSA